MEHIGKKMAEMSEYYRVQHYKPFTISALIYFYLLIYLDYLFSGGYAVYLG
jgi:hypothetical protein